MSVICASVETLVEDALAQQQADLVDHHQLAGIGDSDRQAAVGSLFQRDEVVTEHQVDGNLLEQIMMQLEVVQIHELAAIAPRDVLRPGHFVRNPSGRNGSAVSACARSLVSVSAIAILLPLLNLFLRNSV
jgi:hypothetical protein